MNFRDAWFAFWCGVIDFALNRMERGSIYQSNRKTEGRVTRVVRTKKLEIAVTLCDPTKPLRLEPEEMRDIEAQLDRQRAGGTWQR